MGKENDMNGQKKGNSLLDPMRMENKKEWMKVVPQEIEI